MTADALLVPAVGSDALQFLRYGTGQGAAAPAPDLVQRSGVREPGAE
jgi:hypothetical protein